MTDRKGFFAPEAIPSGWWDETTQPIGWFSDDLLTDVTAGGDFAGTFADRGTAWGTTSASTASITVPAGDLIYVFGFGRRASAVAKPTISDTLGLTWTEVEDYEANDVAAFGWIVCWAAVSTGSATTITVSITASNVMGVHALSVSGAAATYTNTAAVLNSTGDPAPTLPNSLAANSAVLTAFWNFAGAVTPSMPSGFTAIGGAETTTPANSSIWSAQDSTAPTGTATWSTTGARSVGIAIEIFASGSTNYDLTADAGSYAITGTAADVLAARRLTADAGAYAVTGTAATLAKGYRLAADAGAFTVAGTAATLTVARRLTADAASYAVTGADAGLNAGRRLIADGGSYALSGAAAGLVVGRRIATDAGSYSVTGADATLTKSRRLDAEAGAYVITGTAAALLWGRRLAADGGSYAVTGTAATLSKSRVFAADPGAFALTGTAATFTILRPTVDSIRVPVWTAGGAVAVPETQATGTVDVAGPGSSGAVAVPVQAASETIRVRRI